jgi:mono/diheme cytochrome c family protein
VSYPVTRRRLLTSPREYHPDLSKRLVQMDNPFPFPRMFKLSAGVAAILVALALCTASAHAQSGAEDYQRYCASCHGSGGTGKPTTWSGEPLPDLTRLSQGNGGKFPYKEVYGIVDGRNTRWHQRHPGMPYWGVFFEAEKGGAASKAKVESRVAAIVDHIRSLQKN